MSHSRELSELSGKIRHPNSGQYFQLVSSRGLKPNRNLSRFKRRYRLSIELRENVFLGPSAVSNSLYTAALRITLAYGALESLEAFENIRNQPVLNGRCARKYQEDKFKNFRLFLERGSESSLRSELIRLADSKRDTNIRPIISAIRHSMVHGQFNPTAANLLNKSSLQFVLELQEAFLDSIARKSDAIFKQEFDRINQGQA